MAVSSQLDQWEEYLVPKFDEVVKDLKVDLFLDTLRSRKLVARTEYSSLRRLDQDEQARVLLNDILPKKGPESFSIFCNVLLNTDGQQHIVTMILGLSSSLFQQPERPSLLAGGPPRKRSRPSEFLASKGAPSSPDHVTSRCKRATLYFKARHRKTIERRITKLYALFHGSFRIRRNSLKVYFEGDPRYEEDLVDDSYVFESEDEKIVSLVLRGVTADELETKHPEVLDSIAAWLNISRSKIEVLGVMDGSAVVILKMEFDALFELLCSLSEPHKSLELMNILQQKMPCTSGAHIAIAGLPVIFLGSSSVVPNSKKYLVEPVTVCHTATGATALLQTGATRLVNEIQPGLTEDSWTECVLPKITRVTDRLKPNSVMDQLRAKGILSRDEYTELLKVRIQRERARQLVEDILPLKGLVGLTSLCGVLLNSENQRHIVTDIIFPSTATEHSRSGTKASSFNTSSERKCDQTSSLEAEFDQLHVSTDSKVPQDGSLLEASKHESEQVITTGIPDTIQADKTVKHIPSSVSVTTAISTGKLYKDLVAQLELIEKNPFELVWQTSQEQVRKIYDTLIKFVDAILDEEQWREADVPGLLDALKNLTIPETALVPVKQHWEKRLALLKEREQADAQQCLQQSSDDEILVTSTNVYHCALLSQAVYLNSQDDVVSFLNKQPNHQLDGVALSDDTSTPQYLIATSQDVVYTAFRGSDHLSVWAMDSERSTRRSRGGKSRRRTGRASVQRFGYERRTQYAYPESVHVAVPETVAVTNTFRSVSYLPLRYFARQLISRKRVIFTGHSLGGTTAALVTAKLLMEHFQATEENVACVTFGQLSNIAVNGSSVQKIAEMPECFHSFICAQDTIPRSVDFWSIVRKRLMENSRLLYRSTKERGKLPRLPRSIDDFLFPFYFSIFETIDDLAEGTKHCQTGLQRTESLRVRLQRTVSPFWRELMTAVYASSDTLTQYRMGVYHVLDPSLHTHKLYEVWSDRTDISELSFKHKSFEEALFSGPESLMQHSMDYYLKSVADIIMDTTKIRSSSSDAWKVKKLESVVPRVSSTGFQMRGTDQVVVTVEGDNMWFVTQVVIAGVSKPLLVEPCDADKRSVSVVLNAAEVVDESSATREVTVQSHFSECAKFQTEVVAKRFDVTSRQKQLAKYSPSDIMEMAFLQVLLERRIGRSTGLRIGEYSKRFEFVTGFVKRAVEIVPVESILYGIETAESEMLFHCVEAARQLLARRKDSKVQMSEMLMTGLKKAIQRLTRFCVHMIYDADPREAYYATSDFYDENGGVESAHYESYPFVYRETTGRQMNAERAYFPSQNVESYMARRWHAQEAGRQLDVDITHLLHHCHSLIRRLREFGGVRFRSMIKQDSNLLVSEKFLNVASDRLREFQHSLVESMPPMVMALCGLDVKEVYPAVKAKSTLTKHYFQFEPPVDMLDRHRKELNDLAQEQAVSLKLEQENSGDERKTRNTEVDSTSMYTNQKMLQLVTSMRSQFKATSILLGAFMEARIRIPFTRSKSENVEAMFAAATNKLGVGVWALFSLPELELRQLLSLPRMDALVVNVAQFLGEWCDVASESRHYAGKLQFIVNSIREGVNASSQNVHYWLERQLVEQCHKLRIPEHISLDELLSKWDYYFQDDVLSLVTKTYRPLVARWFKWSLMVHNLREKLASYVAVGVIGLVNSGKSRLVERLFGITVAAGTVERQRTTVPFVYSLEEDIPGLDIIDFPGVDDQDPTIPDLAKFLLGLAQLVVFVVDYRKCHTESTQKWIEELKERDIPFIMCFSYGDKLYAEKMRPATESGCERHPDEEYVRQIVETQINDTFKKVDDKVKCLDRSDVMMISIAQDNDSVLNSSEGRKKLESAGIFGPKEIGYKIADKLRILLHKEVAKNLETFVGKKFQERRRTGTLSSSDK